MSVDAARDRVALTASAILGLWLMAAPGILGLDAGARVSHLVAGPIVAALSIIAQSAVVRLVARANVVGGGWLIVAPIVIDHGTWWAESVVVGVLVAVLGLVVRSRSDRFGGGWTSIWTRDDRTRERPGGAIR